MQTIKNIFFLFCGLSLAGLIGVSCKKDSKPGYGVPTITRVTQTIDSTGIDSGSFTQWVIIYGTNLSSAQSVSFNDQTVAYKTFYASDTSVTAQIPRAIPKNVTNTITVTTKGGTATYQFTTVIPALQLNGIFNEYAAIGDTLTLVGQNFDLYGLDTSSTTVTFTGGTTVNVVSGTATTLNVIIPASAQPGPVTLTATAPFAVSQTTAAWYMDHRNFIVDMSNFQGWNGPSYLSSGPDPAPINGPYFKVKKHFQGGFNWDPFCSSWCAMPAALVNDPTQYVNYALKFEMNVPAGTPSLPLPLYMIFNKSTGSKEYFYDPSGTNTFPFNTNGKWETFTVPLSTWGQSLAGFTFTDPTLNGYSTEYPIIMEFMLKDTNPSDADFSICNFRIVPIK
jgi:hypothetical protein